MNNWPTLSYRVLRESYTSIILSLTQKKTRLSLIKLNLITFSHYFHLNSEQERKVFLQNEDIVQPLDDLKPITVQRSQNRNFFLNHIVQDNLKIYNSTK